MIRPPWMPVLAGEVVGCAVDSDRFLLDFRETKLKPTADQEFLHVGAKMPLLELLSKLDIAIHVGEFLYAITDFAEYIKRDALGVVRLIADNVGGISGGMRVGLLADAHGLECTPHNWENVFDLALHFHLELELPNAYWFEMPFPPEYSGRPYFKYKLRIDQDGYVPAPTEPGLG